MAILITTSCHPPFSCDKWLNKNIKPIKIESVVINKFETVSCHGKIVTSTEDTFLFCKCIDNEAWNFIGVGDSIIKERGDVDIKIKKDDNEILKFKFPCCDE